MIQGKLFFLLTCSKIPSFHEIKTNVASIQKVVIRDTGSSKWTAIHHTMSKLNLQAHVQVQNQLEETIVGEIISQNKISIIVHHLLSIETWKEKVFPFLIADLATHDNVRAYFMMYHEVK
jgi:hypothetical protein